MLSNGLLSLELPQMDLAIIQLDDKNSTKFDRLAGIHKVAIEIDEYPLATGLEGGKNENLVSFLRGFDDGFNFSVSVYGDVTKNEELDHYSLSSALLSIIRGVGLRKANLIRGNNAELYAKDVLSRNALDFVIFPKGGKLTLGVTAYIPEVTEFRKRSNERPVVSSQISISSRLARLLVNLSGLERGQLLLDPFCGAGTILAEAIEYGVNCIGIDWDRGRIENARQNLQWLSSNLQKPGSYLLFVGDATKLASILQGKRIDSIVTEPILLPRISSAPRLDKAKKMIRNSSRLYSESLYSISQVMNRGSRLVIVVPSLRTVEGKEVSVLLENTEDAGLKQFFPPGQKFEYPVRMAHESTRWVKRMVYVFERV